MNALLDESDRILGNPVLTARSVVSVERHSRCAERSASGARRFRRVPCKRGLGGIIGETLRVRLPRL